MPRLGIQAAFNPSARTMVAIKEGGSSICEEQILMIEKLIGADLPEDYRRFLLAYNGGIPTPNVIDINGLPGSPTDVQVLFGINRETESSNLEWNFNLIVDRCQNLRLLPIACDSGGNLFCLKMHSATAIEVVYCDLDDMDCSLYPVAMSFNAFMRKLDVVNGENVSEMQ